MLTKKNQEDLDSLVKIANSQDNVLSRDLLYMVFSPEKSNIAEILDCLEKKGISLSDEDVEADTDGDAGEMTPFDPSKIDITMKSLTIDSIIKRIENEEIDFNTSFQRLTGLWSPGQKSRLMESIFLKMPLPAFYFDAANEDKWLVIDGLQRLSTIKEFVINKDTKFKDMEFFPSLNGLLYNQIPRTFKRRLEETLINVYLINPSTPENVKFNLFKRINTGFLVLEPQEIRHALYQGKSTQFLYDCAQLECFRNATSGSVRTQRMLDREFVLRYYSICYLDLNIYNGNIDDFLIEGMKKLNKSSDEELDVVKKNFERAMKYAYSIFGKYAFRKIMGDGMRRPINKVIYESWCNVLHYRNSEEADILVERKDSLIEKYKRICESADYNMFLKAYDKNAMFKRISVVNNLVEEILK